MQFKKYFIFTVTLLSVSALYAEGSALQASNLGNPNISVIGWFQSEAGHRVKNPDEGKAFQLKEAEIGIQSIVDTYAKADFFISVHDNEIDVEEGYINWFALPGGLALKAGKFHANFGKFNRTHTPETAFADRPLVHENYFGQEGLSGTGGSVSWQIPAPIYLNFDGEVFNTPSSDGSILLQEAGKSDLTYVGRLSTYMDMSEQTNLTFGTSYINGAGGQSFDATKNSSTTLNSQAIGLDATLRWKNPRRSIYRSAFWQTEFISARKEIAPNAFENSYGLFSHLDYQFLRRWHTGVRYDYSQIPTDRHQSEKGGLTYVTFTPTEFSLVSLQWRHVRFSNHTNEDIGFLKVTFNIGPHGAHPF